MINLKRSGGGVSHAKRAAQNRGVQWHRPQVELPQFAALGFVARAADGTLCRADHVVIRVKPGRPAPLPEPDSTAALLVSLG